MRVEQPAVLLALLSRSRWSEVRSLISGWDMIDAGCPSREQLEESAGVLVGSALAELGEPWRLRLTEVGEDVRRSAGGRGLGMRQLPGELDALLQHRQLRRVPTPLPPGIYDAALRDYLAPREPHPLRRLWATLTGRAD